MTPQEFATKLQECRRPIWTIAAAILGDASAADDMVQEAASIALGKLDEFDPSTRFVAWMGQIVRYVSLNESRKRKRLRLVNEDSVHRISEVKAEDQVFDSKVAAALETLDETARTCLLMRTVHDLSYTTIAAALGIPEGTAMSHVHRARAALRIRLASLSTEASL